MSYLCENFFETIIEPAVDNLSANNMKNFVKRLTVKQTPVLLSCQDTARIMMGKYEMSQRAYKELRGTLKASNINLPSYDQLKGYCKELDVGTIHNLHDEFCECPCMGYGCTINETLQLVFKCPEYQEKLTFPSSDQNTKLGEFLKAKNKSLYRNFDINKRTIILRDTGDNFRGAGRYPTEQTSFSILNIFDLISGPYGQFITSLWRGFECRQTLEAHCSNHYNELTNLVSSGISLFMNGNLEHFNIVVFLVADLSFVKEILGKCSCTQTYGCFHCNLSLKFWSSIEPQHGSQRTIEEMNAFGVTARETLGSCPNKDSVAYKKLISNNYGQWVNWSDFFCFNM